MISMEALPQLIQRDDSSQNDTFNNTAACGAHDESAVWPYCPSEPAAIAACALFSILTFAHILQAVRWRKAFCWVIILGSGLEFVGYCFRVVATQYQRSLIFYPTMLIILLVTPLIINAWLYMILGRLVDFFVPEKTIGRLYGKRVALVFVLTDLLTFMVQLFAAALATAQGSSELNEIGGYVYVAGVGLQQLSLAVFGYFTIALHRRLRDISNPHPNHPWFPAVLTMYAALVLISIRTIYKIIEYGAGPSVGLLNYEWPWYAFDAAPMLLVTGLLVVMHPGSILQGPGSEYKKIPKQIRKQLVHQYHEEKAAHKKGLDVDSAESALLARSRDPSPQPPMPSSLTPRSFGYGPDSYSDVQDTHTAY